MPPPKDTTEMVSSVPAGRKGTALELAQAICYLASEEAAYTTGTVLDVSGGMNVM